MDDSAFRIKYQKYKLRVKTWERNFKRLYSRVPSKYDIKEAPKEIRDSYKMYYKLKTSFLEDTLNDVLDDDGFNILEISQTENDSTINICHDEGLNISSSIAALVDGETLNDQKNSDELYEPSKNLKVVTYKDFEEKVIKEFDAVKFCKINEEAWGPEVTNVPVDEGSGKQQNDLSALKKPYTSKLSEKLFKSASFSKRNPRKSLSRGNSETSAQAIRQESAPGKLGQSEALPDLETILVLKAKEQQSLAVLAANPLLSVKETSSQINVDAGWLNRNTIDDGLKGTLQSKSSISIPSRTQITEKRYGLTNINVKSLEPSPNVIIAKSGENIDFNLAKPALAIKKTILTKIVANEDSDSVVSDSADEDGEQTHIAKRRRVLRPIEKNQSTVSQPASTDLESHRSKQEEIKEKGIVNHTEDNKNEGKVFDFSTDGNDDEDYSPSKDIKTSRKKLKTIKKKPEKSSKQAKPKRKEVAKKIAVNSNVRKKATKQSKDNLDVNVINMEGLTEDSVEKPPEAEMLRYTMLLERGDLTSTPRVANHELQSADYVAQQYIHDTPVEATRKSVQPMPIINEKRAAARKKLEEKIAAGKLNENYVSINLQKKIFARGKRNINYSKYKKKQWRHKKKIAALAGPDMDMGGCDGGVLTCFTCGQVGHFAAQCKVKGDLLLPLTAQLEEDPSPFPTLEEAERMAAKSAIVVHSRNISKLPVASNSAIYQDIENGAMALQKDIGDNNIKLADKHAMSENEIKNNTSHSCDSENGMSFESDDELNNINLDEVITTSTQGSPIKKYVGHQIPEEFLKKAGLHEKSTGSQIADSQFGGIIPLYELDTNGTVRNDIPTEVTEALHMFGHTNFRKGQERAIMRILSGLSTLVTLSTGSGKSLCYQLPAYLYSHRRKAITLVISPLVSLMEDQVTGVPHFLRAHCLHTNQTPQQRLKVMEMISAGEVDILLVSPEAVVAGERSTGFGAILRQLPPIAFACIDEAHCVSQWSHNFRPSYLMICKVLKQNLGIQTILGLTATATFPTRQSIIRHLGIGDGERGVITDTPLPDNLLLSVSKDENKDAALLSLLLSNRFSNCQSIIVYCTRRDECERVASYLRTSMQDQFKEKDSTTGKRKRKRTNWAAEPYHAGMPASRRRTIQNAFMRNELRIVVATIAFGMGINKPDLRAVIHYNMPRNYESYVQEIGRAGRDGNPAQCHLFLDARGGDKCELRRHIYANSIDRHVIRKLLQHIFVPCACAKTTTTSRSAEQQLQNSKSLEAELCNNRLCPGHEIGFSTERTVQELDIPEENISTLLCYLELDTRWNISVLSNAYTMAKVISYGGPKYLKHAAKNCPPLAMAIALEIKQERMKDNANIIEFSVVDVAAAIGWNSGVVKYQLKNLEWIEVDGYPRRSPINVNFYDIGFRLKAPGDFIPEEIDNALDTLYNRTVEQERTQLIQLQYVFQGLSSVAYNTYIPCSSDNYAPDRSNQLKGIIRDYFQQDYPKEFKLEADASNTSDSDIEHDVLSLTSMYPDNNFSGRNIARIFHGISSPNFPAVIWGRCKYWRAHSKVDFNRILNLANSLIVRRRI